MPARRTIRIVVTAAAMIATALTTAGLTYAASSAPSTVKACVSSKGVLSLLSAKGRCVHGSRAVSIDDRGRTGATGRTGARGTAGVAGPKPISIALDNSDFGVASTSKTFAIGSTGVTVSGTCMPGNEAADKVTLDASSDYYVHGAAQYQDADGEDVATTTESGGSQTIPTGGSLIAYEASGTSSVQTLVVRAVSSDATQLYADLVVLAGGQAFSIHVYAYTAAARCQLVAQIVAP